jgi:protease II
VERAFNVELRNRLLREDFSIPECVGNYEYFMRQASGENFPVYYRRRRSDEATSKAEVVLNQNVEPSLNHGFQFVSGMKISPDATKLLLVMENDSEQCRAVLRDLKTGKLQPLEDVTSLKNIEWSSAPPPDRVFYYTKVDDHGRPFAVYRYNLTTHAQELVRDVFAVLLQT